MSKPSQYELLCSVDTNPEEQTVTSCVEEIVLEKDLYVHVDLVIPEEEENSLRVEITLLRSSEVKYNWFDSENIDLFRDGNRLHVSQTPMADLLGVLYHLDEGEQDEPDAIEHRSKDERGSRSD